jgi:hypothetical protein
MIIDYGAATLFTTTIYNLRGEKEVERSGLSWAAAMNILTLACAPDQPGAMGSVYVQGTDRMVAAFSWDGID